MANKYSVEVLEMSEVHEIPGQWNDESLLRLLSNLEYDDLSSIAPEEIKDMASLALSDLEIDEATDRVLSLRFGDRLSTGQRQNLVEELQEERIWEEYSEMSYHKELFNVSCMMHWAFPKQFSEPDIVRIKIKVQALNEVSISNLKNPTRSFIARLLNDGMDEHNIIYRLFDEQIGSRAFPEANYIIWETEDHGFDPAEKTVTLVIYTSWNWVDELQGVRNYESNAFSDGA
ncbi:MAG: hypothetical protein AAF519_07735 [Bacteroidota bacterium]